MLRYTVTGRFNFAHRLARADGTPLLPDSPGCAAPHGHDAVVRVTYTVAPARNPYDFRRAKEALGSWLRAHDHVPFVWCEDAHYRAWLVAARLAHTVTDEPPLSEVVAALALAHVRGELERGAPPEARVVALSFRETRSNLVTLTPDRA